MTYPPGVQLATLTFSNPSTFLGNEATRTEVTVEATASVVWAATGQPIDNFEEIVSPGAGMPGSLTVPFVDQPGFTDQAGNTFANWAYVVTRKTVYGNKMKTVRKNWQPVTGQTDVDFDNLPGGAIGLPVSAPQVPVTSVAGLTGVVGDEALAGALAPFMPATEVTPEAVAANLPARLEVAALDGAYGPTSEGLQSTFARANDRGHAVSAALALKSGDVNVGLAGDSTGDAVNEWFYKLMQSIAADDAALRVVYKDWDDGTQANVTSTMQAGQPRYVVVKEDIFDRVAADLYGSTATTGGSSWFGNYAGAAGDWSVDGTAAVKTADATVGEMLITTGAMNDTRTRFKYTSVSTFAGVVNTDLIVRRTGTGDNLYIRFGVDNVAGTYQATLRQTIATVATTISSGAVRPIPGDRKFDFTVDIVGTAVTWIDNGTTLTGTLTAGDATILNLGDRQGFKGLANNTGDRVTLFSSQRIDPARTLTAYNGSLAGSTLDYQQPLLASIFPVTLDLLFVSSAHNYGADSAAAYETKLHTFAQTVFSIYPGTGLVIGSQNPKFAPFSGDQRDNHRARCRAARAYAMAHNYGYLPVLETFDKEADGGLSKILSDGLHPNPDGSTLWAGVAKAYLDSLRTSGDAIPVPGPVPGSHILTRTTSETFSGGDVATITGRTTDAALGGTGKTWDSGGTVFAISAATLVRGADTATGQVSILDNPNDVEVSAKVAAIGTSSHYLYCRRADNSGAANRYQVRISGATVCLSKRFNNAYADIGTPRTIVAGDTVAVRAVGTSVQLRINGVLTDDVTDTDVTAGAYCGFLANGSGSTFGFDDFTIDAVTISA